MKQRLLLAIYPLVKDFPDAPLSVVLLSTGFNLTEQEVTIGFMEMIEEKLVQKKYESLSIYMLTKKGIEEVEQAIATSARATVA
jgi:hypothetical protein